MKIDRSAIEFFGGGYTYCIMNKRTGGLVYGTDFRYSPPHQKTSIIHARALTFKDKEDAETAFKKRKCGGDYKIVKVRMEVVDE